MSSDKKPSQNRPLQRDHATRLPVPPPTGGRPDVGSHATRLPIQPPPNPAGKKI